MRGSLENDLPARKLLCVFVFGLALILAGYLLDRYFGEQFLVLPVACVGFGMGLVFAGQSMHESGVWILLIITKFTECLFLFFFVMLSINHDMEVKNGVTAQTYLDAGLGLALAILSSWVLWGFGASSFSSWSRAPADCGAPDNFVDREGSQRE